MTLLECVEGLPVRLALIYWVASFIVLLLRLFTPDFEKLAAYGGHGGSASSGARTHAAQGSAAARGDKKSKAGGAHTWPFFFTAAIQASPLGTRKVSRKQAFTSFYVTGLATSALLLAAHFSEYLRSADPSLLYPTCLSAVPLVLFFLHCGVRLAETRRVQRFRAGDTVTLFAAIAGCTFYTAAAASSSLPPANLSELSSRWMFESTNIQWMIVTGAVTHVWVQVVQVMVHTILAGLRRQAETRKSETTEESQELKESVWRYVQKGLLSCKKTKEKRGGHADEPYALHGSWRTYHFPYSPNPVFQCVLDPHYTCEIVLYSVNTVLMLLCSWPHPLLQEDADAEHTLWHYSCAPMAWLSVVAGAGVTLFTLVNLGITSAGHRRFWSASNDARREVAGVLTGLLSASPEVGNGGRLPAELVDKATQMLQEDLVEEMLPRWNVIPFIW